jgi:hypothetical protein
MALLAIFSAAHLAPAAAPIAPADFQPLTSLPWEDPSTPLARVLDRIFREPNSAIRYPVLAAYLRQIPIADWPQAFERCIDLEGTQTPDTLVAFLLEIWAERDPKACWTRTRELFNVVGVEHGWLNHDSWLNRPPITVQDIEAIRASRFYLTSIALKAFPIGVEKSSLPIGERVEVMKAFADRWFAAFGTWPGVTREPRRYPSESRSLLEVFSRKPDATIAGYVNVGGDEREPCFELAMRRWMEASPDYWYRVMESVEKHHAEPASKGGNRSAPFSLLMIWARTALPEVIEWADKLRSHTNPENFAIKGFLMPRVDEPTRARWLAEARSADPDDPNGKSLFNEWAKWDPKAALDAAAATKDAETLGEAAAAAVEGPFPSAPNTTLFGFSVVTNYNWKNLPDDLWRKAFGDDERGNYVMEPWGDINIGDAARFGFDFVLNAEFIAREDLIQFFSGDDLFADTGDVLDRTFCSLRVWAVFKPAEMEKWIATLKDPEMKKALTHILLDPWGPG